MHTSPPLTESSQGVAVALDLGGTKLAAALVGEDGRPQFKQTTALEARAGTNVGELILAEIRRLLDVAAEQKWGVRGIGVAVPGIASAQTGRVWAPNIGGWEDYPLRAELEAAVEAVTQNVVVESDRAACILGEAWQGAARGCRNAIFLAVGTGIGAGILADGRVLRGAHGIAGALGWLALDRPFEAEYRRWGCFESHASGDGLARIMQRELADRPDYGGPLRTDGNLTAQALFKAYEQHDPLAGRIVRHAIELWGMAAANLVSVFNPEKIIFGGGVFGPATRLLPEIAAEARRWAQPVAMIQVRFESSQLGGDAALVGAAYLAWQENQL